MVDTYCIYMHTAPNGKAYVGMTKDYIRRCRDHQATHVSKCRLFSAAIQKHGWGNFEHEVLLTGLTLDVANDMEDDIIMLFNTLSPNGYNLKRGGRHAALTEDAKAKMSATHTGKKMSPESREKMSIAKAGFRHSEQTKLAIGAHWKGKAKPQDVREKISMSHTGKKMPDGFGKKVAERMLGKKLSQETRDRMRAAWAKRKAAKMAAIDD